MPPNRTHVADVCWNEVMPVAGSLVGSTVIYCPLVEVSGFDQSVYVRRPPGVPFASKSKSCLLLPTVCVPGPIDPTPLIRVFGCVGGTVPALLTSPDERLPLRS